MATQADKLTPSHDRPRLTAGAVERFVSGIVFLAVIAALAWGWWHRGERGINPEHGLGYGLGIAGGAAMLVLLGYPLRKRRRTTSRAAGSVGFWFRLHMLLGLLGPLAILYHSRFTWGALNSAVALGAMLTVATSGLVGRFLYSRVHRGFSDRKLELRSLKDEMDDLIGVIAVPGAERQEIIASLQLFEDRAIAAGGAFWSSAGAVIGLGIESRLAHRRMLAALPRGADRRLLAAREALGDFLQAVRRSAEFAFYDRLLRLWHLLHMPLFILMVAAAVLHIVAVHMY